MRHRNVIAALVIAACLWIGCNSAFADPLVWQTSKAAAVAMANAQGKKILLISGRDERTRAPGLPGCATTEFMKYTACESVSPPIKSLIEQYFIPYYIDVDTPGIDYYGTYAAGLYTVYHLPLICVIDPNNPDTYLDRTTDLQELQVFYPRLLRYATATCTFNLSSSGKEFTASGNAGTFTVIPSSSSCSWTVSNNAPAWITITAGSAGTGNGTVSYSVSENTGFTRMGTMTIGGQTFTVTQSGSAACVSTILPPTSDLFSSSPTHTPFGDVGNKGTVAVTTAVSSCSWGAASTDSWITIIAGSTGTGNGTVFYSVSENTGFTRTGTITIGGQAFTVKQNGTATCDYTIAPASSHLSFSGNTDTVAVTTSSSCPWSAASGASWIVITAGSAGTGNGTVSYSVSANTTGSARTGTMTIGGQTFTVTQAGANTHLYFPYVDTSLPWQTEIALINPGDQPVTGTLRALGDEGQPIEAMAVTLSAHGRQQINVANGFTNHLDIRYIIFDTDSAAVQGYLKLYQTGSYRAAIPAVKAMNTSSNIYISHIASDADWWTWLGLVNTTSATKELTITFNNGQSRKIILTANQHRAFDIAQEFFNNQHQPDIQSAVITNAGGIIGLEFFGSTVGSNQMDGILLTGNAASTIYYPHVAGGEWWTGIVAYNPSNVACQITITPYKAQGTPLSPITRSLAGGEKYIGTPGQLSLPAETEWFKIDSTSPIIGFELFGTVNGNQLAPYAGGGGTGAKAGVFPKIEEKGWTAVVFVNTEDSAGLVTLRAYNNNGNEVATQVLPVAGHAKKFSYADKIFSQDISSATYIAYSSDRNVVGFQLNGTSDGLMLDGLPGL
jgi:hypothetical protein